MASEHTDAATGPPDHGADAWDSADSYYGRIFESANEAIWVCDNEGLTTSANAKMAELSGYSPEEMASLSIHDLLDEQGKVQVASFLELQRRLRGTRDRVECSFLRRDGSRIWAMVSHSPLYDRVGRHVGSVSVVSDITDRRLVDEELRNSGEQLAEAQRVAHLGSWEWDIVADQVSWSDEMYRIFGLVPKELDVTYEDFIGRVHPDDRTTVNDAVGACLQGEPGFEFDNRLIRPGGEVVWIHSLGEVVRDAAGVPLRMRGTGFDITAYKRSQEALEQARDAAMESSRLKSEFLSTMSHEIRTPMNGVIGLTGLLLDTGLDDRQRQFAEGVRGAGEALLAIINDILDFSKIEAAKLQLEVLEFDVTQVVEEAAGLMAQQAQRKGLELVTYGYLGLPTRLRGDPARLRQVLLNLVSNAVKFTQQGEVVLRTRLVEESETAVAVRFEVVDTGIGIAESDQQRLFDAFSQVDASTTRQFGGTGLGLAISRRLVAAMGGDLCVDSEPGRGSTFSFTLRLDRAGDDRTTAPAPGQHVLDGLRVLVVDDNDTNRLILREQLTAWGIEPELAGDGPSALRLLRGAAERGSPFGLALLDLCMANMDGLELARRIGAEPALAGTRLVLLTSTTDVSAADSPEAGLFARLTKPVRSSELYDCLMRLSASEPGVEPDATAVTPSPEGSREHVLVAEDNTTNQLVARGILDKLGYRVDVAANGLEALQALARTDYAAVLMDCHMPEMDGYTATAEIRRREGDTRHTPVIAMTAGAMQGDRERCLAAGMDDYISKPVKPEVLAAALATWIPEACDVRHASTTAANGTHRVT